MEKRVVLTRVFHRGMWRIAINFGFDRKINSHVCKLTGCKFSRTLNCWHVNDSEESIKEILGVFKGTAGVDISGISGGKIRKEGSGVTGKVKENVTAQEKDEAGIAGQGNVPPDEDYWLDDSASGDLSGGAGRRVVEFRINENDGRLSLKFTGGYDPKWIEEIRSYGKYYYDKRRKEFLLPWTRLTTDSLSDYFSSLGVPVKVIRQVLNEEVKAERKDIGDEIRSRELGDGAFEGLQLLRGYLEENRYSQNTVESYLSQLEIFFRYFSVKDPSEITHSEFSDFISAYVIKLGYSSSYQNQMISAVKTYYEISGRGKIIPQVLERPRRSRALPKVFSKEEVSRILSSARNDKHKLLLWIIYSCGLRRSEVINIRMEDLDRERRILHIREGKGRVDRIVPVSDKVWDKIDSYLVSFRPEVFLFEGQGGGRYSSESVYHVFKEALKSAGISKEVGVHCLRHSYATHLHESGLDIRYIQELLGHRSSRTTEIYTHVSRRNLISVRSPIDDLDIS
ncbi:MAG TPA: site-specific tyrosine recombinase/integron integrase [Bacteroidales bacterium]|nr:site-specific tyrosine recombinase/integron integrase [Bacteroidales bacterium]